MKRVILVCVGILLVLLVHYAPLPPYLYSQSSRDIEVLLGLMLVLGWFLHWSRGQNRSKKRWILPLAQFILSLTMVPQVLIVGVPGLLGSLEMIVKGHFDTNLSSVPRPYVWDLAVESLSLDVALVLSLIGALLSIVRPSRVSAWIYTTGAICYWIFIAYVDVSWALGSGFDLRYMTEWEVGPLLIGSMAAVFAYALHSYLKARTSMVCNSDGIEQSS